MLLQHFTYLPYAYLTTLPYIMYIIMRQPCTRAARARGGTLWAHAHRALIRAAARSARQRQKAPHAEFRGLNNSLYFRCLLCVCHVWIAPLLNASSVRHAFLAATQDRRFKERNLFSLRYYSITCVCTGTDGCRYSLIWWTLCRLRLPVSA